jgi:hypothetical protein
MLSDRCVNVGIREKSSEAFDVLLDQLLHYLKIKIAYVGRYQELAWEVWWRIKIFRQNSIGQYKIIGLPVRSRSLNQ